ncbi:hypothetical protein GNI_193340 [Gregarina niphandrodes]|uniref:Uncharacterized protein n=1 Tax=Gregarina niphandrodes TaxID=110365 RepID=A0A023AWE8_GRENI|nr:hypothetical protein GNI_193340 [Gregarina niphandrodes]EZG43044.1 hypothetical protein GNI_193340 [Gregarina niphandrodes]|eukprot:XP_011133684.1 hypothetical protein GNI_193340 [Gregarina niphandrodes]
MVNGRKECEYDLEIRYRKGSENYTADYLSRHVYDPDPVQDFMCH